jgi:hypothetical protein
MSRRPPPPDTAASVRITGQRFVEEFFSSDQMHRVVVMQDESGIYRVRSFRWCIEDWEVGGSVFWMQDDSFTTMTDTLADATRLAKERVAELSQRV